MKVAVLLGGMSSERAISFKSGFAVARALAARGHDVTAIDPADGSVIDLDAPPPAVGRTLEESRANEAVARGSAAVAVHAPCAAALEFVRLPAFVAADVVFIALHGGAGESGALQAVLDMAGKRYTGSGMLASALAMNKALTKQLCAAAGIATAQWRLLSAATRVGAEFCARDIAPLTLPVVVKPNAEGSSVGLTIVRDESGLAPAFAAAAACEDAVLIERFIDGRELTVSVLDDEPFPIVEIIPDSGVYDYEAKYTKGRTRYVCPADVAADVAAQVTSAAVTTYRLLGCRGMARIDFRLAPDGVAYLLEANTVPGLTDTSLVPMAAAARGIAFPDLMDRLVRDAAAHA